MTEMLIVIFHKEDKRPFLLGVVFIYLWLCPVLEWVCAAYLSVKFIHKDVYNLVNQIVFLK